MTSLWWLHFSVSFCFCYCKVNSFVISINRWVMPWSYCCLNKGDMTAISPFPPKDQREIQKIEVIFCRCICCFLILFMQKALVLVFGLTLKNCGSFRLQIKRISCGLLSMPKVFCTLMFRTCTAQCGLVMRISFWMIMHSWNFKTLSILCGSFTISLSMNFVKE